MFKKVCFFSALLSISIIAQTFAQSKNSLYFNKPAEFFEQSLVLGNGKMGASVFGGVNSDKIFLNDATLWSGEPVNPNMNPEAYKNLPAVREALRNEDYKLADQLNKKLQGSFSQSYAPLGTLFLNFSHEGEAKNYYRELDMIRECFQQTINASEILNTDADFRAKLEKALVQLYPYQIGKKGNLQEWYYDWEDQEPTHRHQSHLFGLYPGHQISPEKTPELALACRKTLEIKGDETTGWSKGWRINLWARLLDGNHAYKMFRELLNYVDPDGMRTNYSGGGGTYPNLFDAHPPFQIDGNFGGAAAVAEILVQSDLNEIRLLPALPDAWESGSVSGICARGGFVISMKWEKKNLKEVKIKARETGKTLLKSGNKQQEISLKKGEEIQIIW